MKTCSLVSVHQSGFLSAQFLTLHKRSVHSSSQSPHSCQNTFYICDVEVRHFEVRHFEVRHFEVRHPRCVSNKSNSKLYTYIVRHNDVYSLQFDLYL
jgi:hypothetical protein